MAIILPFWPPDGIGDSAWPLPWFRFEEQYPDSGRPSRLVSHNVAPYVASFDATADPDVLQNALKKIAGFYVHRIESFLDGIVGGPGLGLPNGWSGALDPDKVAAGPDPLQWLDIWPPVGVALDGTKPPHFASWNLSRNDDFALPATIVMVASEIYIENQGVASYSFGVRVPMSVRETNDGIEVIIRSVTAEYPREGTTSFTEMFAGASPAERGERQKIQSNILGLINSDDKTYLFADAGYVDAKTVVHDDFSVEFSDPVNFIGAPFTVTYQSKASGSSDPNSTIRHKFPEPETFQITSKYRFDVGGDNATLISADTCPLAAHAAAPGEAEVFLQTPSGWINSAQPAKTYDWMKRRPVCEDKILDRYRVVRRIDAQPDVELKGAGFVVKRCPDYVPEDKALGHGIKSVNLPGGEAPEPRRNSFSALMSYCNALDFFQLLDDFDLDPAVFVVRAKTDIEIYYRYGIFPGPRRDGNTINAQVAYRCDAENNLAAKPTIKMRLALANLSRWARPELGGGKYGPPEPLGIATSGRWMMHEFGHYLLAARLGQLEFDFAHSAGDAMAAVRFDPYSRLGDMRGDLPETFRGITYPFVFATRRHERSPLLGWSWYGTLNRSIIEAPHAGCNEYKAYLTEQILSSSIFRLYRALGGDTVVDDAPDDYVRYRSSS